MRTYFRTFLPIQIFPINAIVHIFVRHEKRKKQKTKNTEFGFSSLIVHFRPFSPIFTHFHQFSQIFTHFHLSRKLPRTPFGPQGSPAEELPKSHAHKRMTVEGNYISTNKTVTRRDLTYRKMKYESGFPVPQ